MKILIVFGTRPEGIKLAPLIQAIEKSKELECVLLNTGQHKEMLDQVLALFSLQPKYDLKLMKPNQKLDEIISVMITSIGKILDIEEPDLVLVLGDTATTFAGAYAAFLKQIPIGHVEAGLRTFQLYSPFPEEMHRKLVASLSSYHFAPTETNKNNLVAEGIAHERIKVVGNTVIDALLDITNRTFTFPPHLQTIIDRGKRIILVTTHRRENFHKLKGIYNALKQLTEDFNDIEIIFPVHPNPNVRKQVNDYLLTGSKSDRIHIMDPLDYESFSHLMKQSYMIITDSGGIQEEAPALDIPVLVARESTERLEGVKAGTLKIVGTNEAEIVKAARTLLEDSQEYKKMAQIPNPYGDGTASRQIVDFLKNLQVNKGVF